MGAIGSTFIILGLFLLVFTAYRSNFSVSYQTGVMYAVASSLCVLGLMMYGLSWLMFRDKQTRRFLSLSIIYLPLGMLMVFLGECAGVLLVFTIHSVVFLILERMGPQLLGDRMILHEWVTIALLLIFGMVFGGVAKNPSRLGRFLLRGFSSCLIAGMTASIVIFAFRFPRSFGGKSVLDLEGIVESLVGRGGLGTCDYGSWYHALVYCKRGRDPRGKRVDARRA